jgi:hypothetical protein
MILFAHGEQESKHDTFVPFINLGAGEVPPQTFKEVIRQMSLVSLHSAEVGQRAGPF